MKIHAWSLGRKNGTINDHLAGRFWWECKVNTPRVGKAGEWWELVISLTWIDLNGIPLIFSKHAKAQFSLMETDFSIPRFASFAGTFIPQVIGHLR